MTLYRKSIFLYLAQFDKQLKNAFFQKLDIEKTITESEERLLNHEKKVRVLDKLTDVASESLTDYFDKVNIISSNAQPIHIILSVWKMFVLSSKNIVVPFNKFLTKKTNIGKKFMLL
jgi:hypothetical protein